MKAKEVLQLTGITRTHLSRLVKQGKVRVLTKPNGQYIYNVSDVYKYAGKQERQNLNLIYARVSTKKQKTDLSNQINRLENYCAAQGVKVDQVFSEIASGINFEKRKQFFLMLQLVIDGKVDKVFISYKDRLSRVGFGLFKYLFLQFGTEIVFINESNSIQLDHEEIMNEIITLIHCFSMKHYSKRRIKRVIEVLNESKLTAA
jgi:putative resolvase